jgi:ligand-binding sensor domain-containing protein/two-component sensor histidine kinase
VILIQPLVSAAVSPSPTNPEFSLRTWQVEQGLPQNSVTAIAQTDEGYLWIGTYGGLARFDGESFKVFSALTVPSLQDDDVVSLFADPSGSLWIGHESGAVTRYRNGQFENMTGAPALVTRKIVAINSDSTGNVWLLYDDGSLRSAAGGHKLPMREGHPGGALEFARDLRGELYVNRAGEVAKFSHGQLETIDFGMFKTSGYVLGIAAAAGGGLWVARDGHLRIWRDGKWSEDRDLSLLGGESISAMVELRDGSVAVGTSDKGCYLIYPGGKASHIDQSDGLPQNWVRTFATDSEGDLWIGIGTGGLVMMKHALFTVLNAPDKWEGHSVLAVASERNGGLWIGSEGSGLYHYLNGVWSHFDQKQGLWNAYVWSVAEDADGLLWVGTWGGGLFQMVGNRCNPVQGFNAGSSPVLALECMPEHGELWAGVGNNLVHWDHGIATDIFKARSGATNNISTVVRDRSGTVWFGITGGGLGRLSNGQLSLFHRNDGLPSERVNCLLPDGAGTLWIGTADAGLGRLKGGKFSTIGEAEGLPSSVICHIVDDGLGFIWLSTHHGILRLAKDELNRCADGRIRSVAAQIYERDDGLPTLEFSGGLKDGGCVDKDGRLWFASSEGLISVNPAEVQPNRTPPPVVLESIQVDGRLLDNSGNAIDGLKLAPNHMRFEFQFAALSFASSNKVRFKYRLLGLDRDWVDSGSKRSASYSQLAPGNYRFQCIASNGDGFWNLKGAQLAFTILPFYWQTWWFIGLSSLSAFLIIAWAARFEVRRKMQRRFAKLEQERAIEGERARIARDIHDDIGANLTRITLLSQSAPSGLNSPTEAGAILHEISSTAREVTESLDEIVWAVNPKHDTLESLICYMAKFTQDFLNSAHVRCRLDLPSIVPDWPLGTHIRHNLFLAFKEVLHNTVKHSGATEVRLALRITADSFVLEVGDNGRGIVTLPAAGSPRVGNGFTNLQHRLAQIGGHYEIASTPCVGTTVLLIVGDLRGSITKAGYNSLPTPQPP